MAIENSFSRSSIRPGILGATVAFLVLVMWVPVQAGTAKPSHAAKGARATATLSPVLGEGGPESPAPTPAVADAAFIRVNQVGYEAGTSARAYLMSTAAETGATFSVINSEGATAFHGPIGAQVGSWANCSSTTGSGSKKTCNATSGFTTNPVYSVYALDFTVRGGDSYYITVSGPVTPANSYVFPVASPATLYEKLLGNTLFYYDSVRDGPDFVPGPMSPHPSHLNNENAAVYWNPAIDNNDNFTGANTCGGLYTCAWKPYAPVPTIDASGGFWDAGDNLKYTETESYVAALMQIGVRDFPNQMGPNAPTDVPSRPGPMTPNFLPSTQFLMDFMMKMWNDNNKLLFLQVGNTQDWNNFSLLGDYDIWRLPWYDDNWQEPGLAEFPIEVTIRLGSGGTGYTSAPTCSITGGGGSDATCTASFSSSAHTVTGVTLVTSGSGYTSAPTCSLTGGGGSGANCTASLSTTVGDGDGNEPPCSATTTYLICHEPVIIAQAAGSTTDPAGQPISPNLAGRVAADFALYYQLNHTTNPAAANQALKYAEDIFAQADLTYADPAGSSKRLVTIVPFDGYGESVWDDDMELGATEIYFALQSAEGNPPAGLMDNNPMDYLTKAATFANNYITKISGKDTLNLYDVSGLAHFELYRALGLAGNPTGLATTQSALLSALQTQVTSLETASASDAFGYGKGWTSGDVTSHGDGTAVMASEVDYLTHSNAHDVYSRRWLGNMMGANSWGLSFIIGDGSNWPNCPQQQPANLIGSLTGGFPELYGGAVEGPSGASTGGYLTMNPCPVGGNGTTPDNYAIYNGVNGATPKTSGNAAFRDNVQSYSNTEPAIDLTSTSYLMFSWRIAGAPAATNLTGLVTAKSGSDAARNWTIALDNNGPFGANAAEIDGLHLTQTGGAACSPSVASTFPVAVGDIAWGSSKLGVVTIRFNGCPNNARFTVNFTFSADGGAVTGSRTLYNQFQ